jgi:hypothetical protein
MIILGVYKHDVSGWSISLEGPDKGVFINPATGERMEFIDFFAWAYDISKEEAACEILTFCLKSKYSSS